ncbi:methyl jasmonate esterase 1-like [Malania oleifera]|uniref:methyl jasmonate esterase 1-like n=1 Tax=Malania oleifera TaxID=397392 RepID=UPI0025ADBE62|nr:methyl jasmonate esterase 1-like [Malania oleifera]
MEKRKNHLVALLSLSTLLLSLQLNHNVARAAPYKPPPGPGPGRTTTVTRHFVLVHGACLGAWSWYKLVPLLKSSGHNVTAVDLAASGIDPAQADDLRFMSAYFRPLMDFMAALPPRQRVILVSHSFGGLAISKAMERFPEKIAAAVFVTALMPGPSLNISALYQEGSRSKESLLDSYYIYGNGPNNPPTIFVLGPLQLAEDMFQMSPIEDLTLASMLVRPFRVFTQEEQSRELVLSTENYGSVRRVYIISNEDNNEKPNFQRWMVMKNPPDEVKIIADSDHMVMISQPIELYVHLQNIAKKYS